MQAQTDAELLHSYIADGSEPSFTHLVTRYTNFVYSAALRQVESPTVASEVTQKVFIALARSAGALMTGLRQDGSLAGWLCRTTRNISLKSRRDDFRRLSLERAAVEHFDDRPEGTSDWERLRPVLDEAMAELNERDYGAVVMRFFHEKDFRSIGAAMGGSDDAAQKRVSRALEKLRENLSRRGVRTTAAALMITLPANAVQSAPAGLAATIASAASVGTTAGVQAAATSFNVLAMTTLQKILIGATLAVAVGTVVFETRRAASLQRKVDLLEQQAIEFQSQIQQLKSQNDPVALRQGLAQENNKDAVELLRLRNEVTRLRTEANAAAVEPFSSALAGPVALLKRKLKDMPERAIPELQFVTSKDWADAVRDSDLSTEDGVREALSKLRESAINTFLNEMMKRAVKKYLAAHQGLLPADIVDLKDYFDEPVTEAMLRRYKLLQTGKPDNGAPLINLTAPYADNEFDSNHGISINGAWGGRFNRVKETVESAAATYSREHNGVAPTEAAQLTPYLKKEIETATVQRYLAQSAADPPPAEVVALRPALNAYRESNQGRTPSNPFQLVPYLKTPEEQVAFLNMQQLPPDAAALVPALKDYMAAHQGQPPERASDLSQYVKTDEERAALRKVEESQHSGSN